MTRKERTKALSHGRPPTVQKRTASSSSRATRTLIRSHHQLHKKLAKATHDGNSDVAAEITKQIEDQGGLKTYQQASITGQSSERGGDSSKVLIKWLKSATIRTPTRTTDDTVSNAEDRQRFRMLEVGALSKTNACSRSSLFSVTRIDLHSQDPSIEQQDFMERPLPRSESDKFDIISLSLVLNYVPDAVERGEMLRRTCAFLRAGTDHIPAETSEEAMFPSLFLVLPAPCITNSRYLDENRLTQIMENLGYALVRRKLSAKLAYYLWRHDGTSPPPSRFEKKEVNPGKTRNNFCIVLP